MFRHSFLVSLACSTVLLTGCTNFAGFSALDVQAPKFLTSLVYRPDVHQGNLLTEEMLGQVQLDQTRDQVLFTLGEPLIRDQFHTNRWDYTYYTNPLKGEPSYRLCTIFFDENNRVRLIRHHTLPSEQNADRMIMGRDHDYVSDVDKVTEIGAPTPPVPATPSEQK